MGELLDRRILDRLPEPYHRATSDSIQIPVHNCLLAPQRTLQVRRNWPLLVDWGKEPLCQPHGHTNHAKPPLRSTRVTMIGQPEIRNGGIHVSYVPGACAFGTHLTRTYFTQVWYGGYFAYQRVCRKQRAGKLKKRRR